MEAIEELSQLSDAMRQAAAMLADEDVDDTTVSSSCRNSTFLNAVALGNVKPCIAALHHHYLESTFHRPCSNTEGSVGSGITAEQLEQLIRMLPVSSKGGGSESEDEMQVNYASIVLCNLAQSNTHG